LLLLFFIYIFLLQELGSLFSNLEMLVGVNQEIMKGLKDDPNGDRTGQTFLGLVLSPPTPNSLRAVIFAFGKGVSAHLRRYLCTDALLQDVHRVLCQPTTLGQHAHEMQSQEPGLRLLPRRTPAYSQQHYYYYCYCLDDDVLIYRP
jgi:hypothetical protein